MSQIKAAIKLVSIGKPQGWSPVGSQQISSVGNVLEKCLHFFQIKFWQKCTHPQEIKTVKGSQT
jgi:hypothetical protein